jgi:hypothetical protein
LQNSNGTKNQQLLESNNPEALKNNFTDKIGTTAVNSLNQVKFIFLLKARLQQVNL